MGKGKEKDFGVKVLGRAELGELLLVRKVAGLQQRKGRCGASRAELGCGCGGGRQAQSMVAERCGFQVVPGE